MSDFCFEVTFAFDVPFPRMLRISTMLSLLEDIVPIYIENEDININFKLNNLLILVL